MTFLKKLLYYILSIWLLIFKYIFMATKLFNSIVLVDIPWSITLTKKVFEKESEKGIEIFEIYILEKWRIVYKDYKKTIIFDEFTLNKTDLKNLINLKIDLD